MRKLDNSRVSEGDITYDQKTLDSEKARKIETEKDLEEQKFGEKIAAGESELKKLEESREALLETLSGLNKQAETRAALGLKRADLKNKEESIQSTFVHFSLFAIILLTCVPLFRLDDILVEYRELAKKDLVKANMDKDISDAVGLVIFLL